MYLCMCNDANVLNFARQAYTKYASTHTTYTGLPGSTGTLRDTVNLVFNKKSLSWSSKLWLSINKMDESPQDNRQNGAKPAMTTD